MFVKIGIEDLNVKIVKIVTAVLVIAIQFFGLFEGTTFRNPVLYGLFGFLAIIIAYPFIRKFYLHQMMTNLKVRFKVDRHVDDEAFTQALIQAIDQLPYTVAGENLRQYSKSVYPRFEEMNAILIRFDRIKQQKASNNEKHNVQ